MATYSSNTTIKVNGAVSARSVGAGTLYTAPATGYAILNVTLESSGTLTLAGRTILVLSTTQLIYVGPSQALACTSGTFNATGVEFVNTP